MLKAKFNTYFLVGLFFFLSVILLILFFVFKGGLFEKRHQYYAEFNNVAGLQLGASILYEGYTIGDVKEITPKQKENKMLFDVTLNIRTDWNIPEDSFAIIDTVNLLSKESVIITAGNSMNFLKPNDFIETKIKADIFSTANQLAQKINNLADDKLLPAITENIEFFNSTAKNLTDNVKFTSDEILDLTRDIKDLVDKVSKDLSEDIQLASNNLAILSEDSKEFFNSTSENIEKNLITAGDNIVDLTEKVNQMIASEDISSKLENFTSNLEDISFITKNLIEQLDEISEETGNNMLQSSDDLLFILETVGNNIVNLNESLDQTLRNFESFSRQLKNNPSVIIRGTENE